MYRIWIVPIYLSLEKQNNGVCQLPPSGFFPQDWGECRANLQCISPSSQNTSKDCWHSYIITKEIMLTGSKLLQFRRAVGKNRIFTMNIFIFAQSTSFLEHIFLLNMIPNSKKVMGKLYFPFFHLPIKTSLDSVGFPNLPSPNTNLPSPNHLVSLFYTLLAPLSVTT